MLNIYIYRVIYAKCSFIKGQEVIEVPKSDSRFNLGRLSIDINSKMSKKRVRNDEKKAGPTTVAYLGGNHSFTHMAAVDFFDTQEDEFNIVSGGNLRNVFDSVRAGDVGYGVVPIESSTSGTLQAVLDLLLVHNGSVEIVGESRKQEQNALVSEAAFEIDIGRVLAHPAILDACADYLNSMDKKREEAGRSAIIRIPSIDSSTACATVAAEHAEPSLIADGNVAAAIANQECAQSNKLGVIHDHIGSDVNSETRYIVIAKAGDGGVGNHTLFHQQSTKKASLILVANNEAGSLMKWSSCFAMRNVNILKVESRPAATAMHLNKKANIHLRHFDLIFHIDYEISTDDKKDAALIENLKEFTSFLKVTGRYNGASAHAVEASPLLSTLLY